MKITIRTLTDLHVGSGQTNGIVDNDIILDRRGHPYIPASSIKGTLRDSCLEIASLLGLAICDGQHVEKDGRKLCGVSFERPYGQEPCLMCQVFGSYGNEGKLRLLDASATGWKQDAKFMFTGHNRVSRTTGAASDNALFIARHVPAGTYFETELRLESLPSAIAPLAEAFVKLGLLNLRRIGGRRRRGKGLVSISVEGPAAHVDSVKKLMAQVRATASVSGREKTSLAPQLPSPSGRPVSATLVFKLNTAMIINDNQIAGNHFATLDYIPSGNISGIFFKKLMDEFNDESLLQKFTGECRISFPSLFMSKDGTPLMPWPLAVFECSKARGEKNGHSAPRALFGSQDSLCECGAAMSPKRSCLCAYDNNGDGLKISIHGTPLKTVRMRNNIDASSQAVNKSGGLYSYEEILEGQEFSGTIKFDSEETYKFWKQVLFKGSDSIEVSFGRGRSRGLGAGTLSCREISAADAKASGFPLSKDGKAVVLVLSDAIVLDEFLEPSASGLKESLERLSPGLRFSLDEKDLFVEYRIKRGFNSHKGLPAIPEMAIAPGTVFTIKFDDPKGDENKISEFLNKLSFYGIGERTAEGFGRVAVAPFRADAGITVERQKEADGLCPSAARTRLTEEEMKLFKRLDAFLENNRHSIRSMPSASAINNIAHKLNIAGQDKAAGIIEKESNKSTAQAKWYVNVWDGDRQVSFLDFITQNEFSGKMAVETFKWLAKIMNMRKKTDSVER